MKNISDEIGVFGASGQDGSLMTNFLLKKKNTVIAVVRKKNKYLSNLQTVYKKKLKIIISNKFVAKSYEKILSGHKFKYIFFFAGYSKIPLSKREKKICNESNYNIFKIFLNSCLKLNIKAKILYLSSSEIFGSNQIKKKNEKSKLISSNCYSKCKIKSFKMINKFRKKFNFHITNAICYNHESEFTPKNHLIRKIIKLLKSNKKKVTIYNPTEKRNISYAEDFLPYFYKAIKEKKSDNYIFANNENITVKEISEYYNKIFNKKIIYISKKNLISRMASNKKLVKKFNYKPKFSTFKILKQMLINDNKKLYLK